MKTLSIVSALIGTVVALSSSIAAASAEQTSASACAQAFAAQLASSNGAVPTYKLQYESTGPASMTAQYYATRYTFEMSARQPNSTSQIARATCVTSRSGKIISLTSLPAGAEATKLAARM